MILLDHHLNRNNFIFLLMETFFINQCETLKNKMFPKKFAQIKKHPATSVFEDEQQKK
jgi:hypothetical protein